jgi:hypothetical protein
MDESTTASDQLLIGWFQPKLKVPNQKYGGLWELMNNPEPGADAPTSVQSTMERGAVVMAGVTDEKHLKGGNAKYLRGGRVVIKCKFGKPLLWKLAELPCRKSITMTPTHWVNLRNFSFLLAPVRSEIGVSQVCVGIAEHGDDVGGVLSRGRCRSSRARGRCSSTEVQVVDEDGAGAHDLETVHHCQVHCWREGAQRNVHALPAGVCGRPALIESEIITPAVSSMSML